MADIWPSSLPSCFILGSHSESMGDGLLRSSMDMGPAKIRRRSSYIPRSLSGALQMTAEQVLILQSFVNVTLLGGSLPFSMRAQVGNDRILARFRALPSWERISGNRFTVQINVEVLDSLPALPPVFSTAAMPMGRENIAYSWSPTITDGARPFRSFAITAGSLPPGLRLEANTGQVVGTASVFGTFSFTLQVTDALGRSAVVHRSVRIRPPGFVFLNVGSSRTLIDPIIDRPTAGASFIGKDGQTTASPPNEPRFDYHPQTGAFRGVLIEAASANMWAHSGLGTGWTGDGAVAPTITNGVSGLGHRMVAIEFAANEQVGYHGTHARGGSTAIVPAGVTHTHSIYMTLSRPLRSGESLLYYATGNNAAPGVYLDPSNSAHLVGQWGRIIPAPFTPTFDSFVYPVVTPNTSIQSPLVVYVSYWQMEPGNSASTPILTEANPQARYADIVSFDLPGPRNSILYTFDDGSTRTLTVDGYTHTVPLNFPRKHIRHIDVTAIA